MERDASGLAGPSGILDVTASIKDRLAMIHAKTLGKGLVLPYEQSSRGRRVDTAPEVKLSEYW